MKNYLRDDLIKLKPYKVIEKNIRHKMDANESPWDMPKLIREILAQELANGISLNRYPDSNAFYLREAIGDYVQMSPSQIIVGSGSDELIQMIATAFVDKGDYVIYPTPSFGMYKISTIIAGGNPIEIPLSKEYEYDIDDFISAIHRYSPKLLFLCSPNNPTGNLLDLSQVRELIKDFPGIVAIDEAYGEFTRDTSLRLVKEFPNLLVLRTFSKAFGLAGLRIGYCVTSPELAEQLCKVKAPYNINSFSQRAGILTLENIDLVKDRINQIINQRKFLYQALKEIPNIKVYPSEGNFLLIRVPDGEGIWSKLLDRGILVRNFAKHPYLDNCLRVTVADETTNLKFINAMTEILGQEEK